MSGKKQPRQTISPILARHRVIVCVGAGGVGKTTLAATMAVQSARAGRKVICLTIDPARRLADSLGVSPSSTGNGIQDITHILNDQLYPGGRLSFGMLDPKTAFAEMVRTRSSSPEAAERILTNPLYRYVSGSLSGMQEYMALEQLALIRSQSDVDLIILDTPPTTNAIDFFTAPRRMTEALDGKLVRIMRRAYGGASRAGFDFLGRWASTVLGTLSRFTGTELLSEMMGFIDALADLFGSFSERAAIVEQVLRSNEVAFCLVTTPDKATLHETRAFHDRLSGLGLTVNAVLFNRAHWPMADTPPSTVEQDVHLQILEYNKHWNTMYEREKLFIRRIQKGWNDLESVVTIPILPEGASRIESLNQIARYL
jgi:anion-transporting  ArsA/GET3 family ATPase